ncbi:C-C motif chemokine 34b.8 [Poeciliopsis prolifica]|uniref:C-C motif chemokine 34b.8 n=1 Tax=Poeciliopsis prolifica TaxID=188132 RepID=UPI002413CF9B|nr:C-C motif chemokine 34b.8 [Poeciliopsis prolifica]
MSFSANCRVAIICAAVLLFLHVQGQKNRTIVFRDGIDLPCCTNTSAAKIIEEVRACYEQREHTFAGCKVHAFIFVTVLNIPYCVDPKASWLPSRLKELSAKGINCSVL